MKLRRSLKPIAGPFDMTALIDVVLTLLIFFMLSSTFVLQPGIKVNPPRGPGGSGIRDSRYILNVTAQHPPMIFLNDQVVPLEKLDAAMKAIAREQVDATLVLRADRDVPHGLVTEIMSRALAAGLGVMIATQPADTGSAP